MNNTLYVALDSDGKIGLNWYEYASLTATLLCSIAVGTYYGVCRSNKTADNYMFGDKTMGLLPITLSLLMSAASGVTLLGKPAESYAYGAMYCACMSVAATGSTLFNVLVFIPVVYSLKLTSLYEYFKIRFDDKVRKLTIFVFIITKMAFAAVVIFPAAIVINQFSGIHINLIAIGLIICCNFYTMLGGFQGVVMVNMLQAFISLATFVILLGIGLYRVGGLKEVLSVANKTGRLDIFDFTLDPSIRLTFWSVGIGNIFHMAGHLGVNQAMYQRFVSLPTENLAKWSAALASTGFFIFTIIPTLLGLVVYTMYEGCDPKTAKIVDNYTKVIVYWVGDVGREVSGIRGIFIAGMAFGSLGVISTIMNSTAGLLFTEFIRPNFKMTESYSKTVVKLLVALIGVVIVMIVYLIRDVTSLLELAIAFSGAGEGLTMGLFTLGLLVVPANGNGAFWGGLISFTVVLSSVIGSRINLAKGYIPPFPLKSMRTDECPFNVTISPVLNSTLQELPHVFPLFKLTSFYYAMTGTLLAVLLGTLISLIFKDDDQCTRPEVFSKYVRRYLPSPKVYEEVPLDENVIRKGNDSSSKPNGNYEENNLKIKNSV